MLAGIEVEVAGVADVTGRSALTGGTAPGGSKRPSRALSCPQCLK